MRSSLLPLAALISLTAIAAADSPSADHSATQARVCTLKATTIISQTLHILSSDREAESKAITGIEGKLTAAHIAMTGGPIFIFHQLPADPSAPIDLEIGLPVADDSKAPEGCQVRVLAAAPAVTAIYQGLEAGIGEAAEDLFQHLADLHQTPTGEFRTRSLYYEGPGSPNNIALLEIPVAPAK